VRKLRQPPVAAEQGRCLEGAFAFSIPIVISHSDLAILFMHNVIAYVREAKLAFG